MKGHLRKLISGLCEYIWVLVFTNCPWGNDLTSGLGVACCRLVFCLLVWVFFRENVCVVRLLIALIVSP